MQKRLALRNIFLLILLGIVLQAIFLEAGCDIKYIQALLGHTDPKSTEIYLHVSNKTLLGIKSPFDVQED